MASNEKFTLEIDMSKLGAAWQSESPAAKDFRSV
jgi:hypothetical protein